MLIEKIVSREDVLAIIVRCEFSEPGIHFVTPHDFSQQLAFMNHPAGKVIKPHVHNLVHRDVTYTQEVLFIKKGSLRVDFYDADQTYLESRVLRAGDVILLASAGHGFEALEEIEMVEVKQGPYTELEDKVRFDGISSSQAVLHDDEE
jgi:mannose-6-phosphate isomerase-like protein (cupin superfamily)